MKTAGLTTGAACTEAANSNESRSRRRGTSARSLQAEVKGLGGLAGDRGAVCGTRREAPASCCAARLTIENVARLGFQHADVLDRAGGGDGEGQLDVP